MHKLNNKLKCHLVNNQFNKILDLKNDIEKK